MDNGFYAFKSRLFGYIAQGRCDAVVTDELLPKGVGLLTEKAFWDYKAVLPTTPPSDCSDADRSLYNFKFSGIIKDIVAFYNSYGGYILAGVDDKTRTVVGFHGHFAIDDAQKRALAATGHEIDCHYSLHEVQTSEGLRTIGLLYVPRRPYSRFPAQFRRDGPKPTTGGQAAYHADDIYLRIGDQCKPAQSAEEFTFLCGNSKREVSLSEEFRNGYLLMNNLGPRDPGFITFVGRESYLRQLWRWVCDGFTPVKVLAGIGGVGKTTLAREFAEDLVRNPPDGIAKLIWLSAKKQFYTAIQGVFQPTSRVDFSDTKTLLRAILLELGTPDALLDPDWTIQELAEEVTRSLRLFPSIIIVDDVDSLTSVDQQDVFQTFVQIIAETMGREHAASLALLTARLDLGAAPRQLLRVTGLELDDFAEYCKITADSLGIPLNLRKSAPLMRHFHTTTDGSPTFAASILRVVQSGAGLDVVIKRWKGSDGDEVRRFAFEKELDQLSDSQIRTLYAACLLGESSYLELQTILQSSDRLLTEDMAALRKYHLVGLGENLPGGVQIVIPSSLTLLIDLIGDRVRDPRRLEHACAKVKKTAPTPVAEVAHAIRRVSALWRAGKPDEALQVAQVAERSWPENPDLKCLLGRAFLEIVPAEPVHAEQQLKRAHEMKCTRFELAELWLKTKAMRDDWVGVLEVSKLFEGTPTSILSRVWAYLQLGEIAIKSGNLRRAADQWAVGARELDSARSQGGLRGREAQATQIGRELSENIVRIQDKLCVRAGDRLEVWGTLVDGVNRGLQDINLVGVGVAALKDWWGEVEQRKTVDLRAREILLSNLRKLDSIIRQFSDAGLANELIIASLEGSRAWLHSRAKTYGEWSDSD